MNTVNIFLYIQLNFKKKIDQHKPTLTLFCGNGRSSWDLAGVRPCLDLKTFHLKLSYRNLRHMHGVLNIDEIKKLIAQFDWKSRDERFEPN
jgi:hypothetical protein